MYQFPRMLESSPQSRTDSPNAPKVSQALEGGASVSKAWVDGMIESVGAINTDLIRVSRDGFSGDVPKAALISWLEDYAKMTPEQRKGYGLWINNSGANAIFYPFIDTFEVNGLSQP